MMGAYSKQFNFDFPKANTKLGKAGDFKNIIEKATNVIETTLNNSIDTIVNIISSSDNKMVDAENIKEYKLITKFNNTNIDIDNPTNSDYMNTSSTVIDTNLSSIIGLAELKDNVTWKTITTTSNKAWDDSTYGALVLLLDKLISTKYSWFANCTIMEKYLVICGLLDNLNMSGFGVHKGEAVVTGRQVYFKYFDYLYRWAYSSKLRDIDDILYI